MRQLSVLVALSLFTTPALALRCGSHIVSTGDSTLRLMKYCGQPTLVEPLQDRIQIYDPSQGGYIIDDIGQAGEIWTYNFGPRRFVTRITIQRGTIQNIESSGYGY